MPPRQCVLAAALFTVCAVLAGCAGPRVVDSTVQSFSTLPAMPAPPTYRMERLPSQQAEGPAFAILQSHAESALQRAGLQRGDAQARLAVQISAHASTVIPDWPHYSAPFGHLGWGFGVGYGVNPMFAMSLRERPPTLYRRAVGLTLRDTTTQQVVYETSAIYEDIWLDDARIWSLLFDAALSGFPTPPAGPRQVRATLTPAPAPAPAGPSAPGAPSPAPAR